MSHRVSKVGSSLLSAMVGGLLAQSAWSADSLAQRIEACAQQQDDASRLKCFDHEASVLRAEGAARASANSGARDGASAAPAAAKAASDAKGAAASSVRASSTSSLSSAVAVDRAGTPSHAAEPSRAAAPASPREVPATPQPVTARIVSISTTPSDGALRFELDNGQVWQQNERETYLSLAKGDSVLIKMGSFRSFVLRTPSGVTTRVHQVR